MCTSTCFCGASDTVPGPQHKKICPVYQEKYDKLESIARQRKRSYWDWDYFQARKMGHRFPGLYADKRNPL